MARQTRAKAEEKTGWLDKLSDFAARSIVAITRSLPLCLIFILAGIGSYELWRYALKNPRFIIAGETLSLSNSKEFCPEAVREVERLGKQASGRSLLDPFLLSDLRGVYGNSSWVKRVCTMKRVFPNTLAVEFIIRKPAAYVKQGSYYWTVDEDGVFLNVPGKARPDASLPVIIGTTSDAIGKRPSMPGSVWQDSGVQDALGIYRTIQVSPLSEDVEVKKLLVHGGSFLNRLSRRVKKRPRVDIETEAGVTIRWGTYNSGEYPDEMLSSEKLAMLRNLVARDFASIPGVSLDVRTKVPGFQFPQDR
ncbi:MAG: hypothetical protein JXR97_11815 [Planctomycetes bacterium]|nr:hypothetical protein [Planctomycetota bacterium]